MPLATLCLPCQRAMHLQYRGLWVTVALGLSGLHRFFFGGSVGLVLGGLQVAISEATRQGGDHIATAGQAL